MLGHTLILGNFRIYIFTEYKNIYTGYSKPLVKRSLDTKSLGICITKFSPSLGWEQKWSDLDRLYIRDLLYFSKSKYEE